jgi:flagellar hook-associated protein 1 FlgK
MSLTSALSIAQQALLNTSRQTSVVSRNISEANNPDYARRSAVLTSTAPGARVAQIQRAANEVLFRQNLTALSQFKAQDALLSGMETLNQRVNGVDQSSAAATLLTDLQTALQTFSANPSNRSLADNVVETARTLARTLNDSSTAIQSFRAETDLQISLAVSDLNGLLADFGEANKAVMAATRNGLDASDALDQRESILKKIAEYVPVSTITRSDNDMMIVASDGAVLFETVARTVSFTPNAAYTAGMTGNAIYVDGVPLTAGAGGNTSASGQLAAMLQLRDDTAPAMQRQLDEIARGLVESFAETDPGGVQPDAPGLFTWSGAPAMPASGTLVNGLAGLISINAAMDSGAGGNPLLLRDGGANGAAYVRNTDGAGFSGLILEYSSRLDAPRSFDAAAGISTSTSLTGFATDAISWLEAGRQEATRAAETRSATLARTSSALSNATGVNVDEEMSLLLDLEHSYEASARIIRAVDEMLKALLAAVN